MAFYPCIFLWIIGSVILYPTHFTSGLEGSTNVRVWAWENTLLKDFNNLKYLRVSWRGTKKTHTVPGEGSWAMQRWCVVNQTEGGRGHGSVGSTLILGKCLFYRCHPVGRQTAVIRDHEKRRAGETAEQYLLPIKAGLLQSSKDPLGDTHWSTEEWSDRKPEIYIQTSQGGIWVSLVSVFKPPSGNPEKWYRWTYLQSRNRDTDTENKCMDTRGEGGVGWIGRLGLTHIHYWYYV